MKQNTINFLFILVTYLILSSVVTGSELPTKVFVKTVKKQKVEEKLTYPARLISTVNATLLAETEGVVVQIASHIGKRVSRKTEVLRIKNTDPIYQYQDVRIFSPVQGVLSTLDVSVGSQVVKGQKLATVTEPRKLKVLIEVPSNDLPQVKLGLKGEFSVPGSSKKRAVEVTGIGAFVDTATGTTTAEISFLHPEDDLNPGLIGSAELILGSKESILVPESSVFYRSGATFLKVVNDFKAKHVPVVLGRMHSENIEIQKGLSEGDVVIVRAGQFIADGDDVTIEKDGDVKVE